MDHNQIELDTWVNILTRNVLFLVWDRCCTYSMQAQSHGARELLDCISKSNLLLNDQYFQSNKGQPLHATHGKSHLVCMCIPSSYKREFGFISIPLQNMCSIKIFLKYT